MKLFAKTLGAGGRRHLYFLGWHILHWQKESLEKIMAAALADPRGMGGLRLKLWSLHVPEDYYYLFYEMPPGAVCIDGGANIGQFTDAVIHQGGVSFAFEPNATLFALLSRKYAGNASVRLFPAAIGAREETVAFSLPAQSRKNPLRAWSGGRLLTGREKHPPTTAGEVVGEANVIDFAEFLKKEFGQDPSEPPIYLIKLDIEGSEFELLERLVAEGLHKLAKYIVVETHARFFPDGHQKLARLRRMIQEAGAENIELGWK